MNERLKKLRSVLKLTQKEFAKRINIQPNTIATYEMGIRSPNRSTIAIICQEFNVNENWLRDGDGEMFLTLEQINESVPSINERIFKIRITLRLSMEQFGEHLGVRRSAISCIESGKHSVSNQMFKSICREFGVSEKWLRTGEGEMFVHASANETKLQLLHLIDELPENKLGYVLAYVQGLCINECIEKE